MTILESIRTRKIEEVLHFTTSPGLAGILATKVVHPRSVLPDDKHVEHIMNVVCEDRHWDEAWHGYVNLSISRINLRLFNIASERWHPTNWWVILSFDPVILTHPGVFFTQTNNRYSGVQRRDGIDGMNAMFEDRVELWYGKYERRDTTLPDNHTTCRQAEALYPDDLSVEWLRKIYVRSHDDSDQTHAICETLSFTGVPIITRPEMFQ